MVTTERKKSSTKECKKVKIEKGFERKCIYNMRNKYREKEGKEDRKMEKKKKKRWKYREKERL